MRTFGVIAGSVAALSVPSLIRAQSRFDTPHGTVEVLGLRRWTVGMIQDSAAKYAPGNDLASHACAAILRSKLGFADASVVVYPSATDSAKALYIVTVIEPQDSAVVRYKPPYSDSLPERSDWQLVIDVFQAHPGDFQRAIQRPGFLTSATLTPDEATEFSAALPVRNLVRAHGNPADFRLALTTIARDGNSSNRLAALLLLTNFVASDSAWWSLLDAVRDPTPFVAGTAGQLLGMLVRSTPRRVDWEPMAGTVRALLDGTSLFEHNVVMQTLAATEVSPRLASRLLANSGDLVLAKLASSDPAGRDAAHRLLVQLSGHDLGFAPDQWRRWIAGL